MNIALVAPPYPLSEAPSPPLGITYVAGAFETAGANVKIFDYIVSAYNKDKLAKQIASFSPIAIGVGCVTMNFYHAVEILRDAKEIKPSLITIIGGAHVSFSALETLQKYPFIDIVVIGEAETTIAELTPNLNNHHAWKNIAGIAFQHNGEIVVNPSRDFIVDINSIPLPARHLLPIARYRALGFPISIITSRGCQHKCIFCQGRRMVGSKPRLRKCNLVVDEIESILKMGFDRINIADDHFTSDLQRTQDICFEIMRRKLVFSWSAFVRANTVNFETLSIMKQAGCDSVSFGVESGNPQILKNIKKGITIDIVRRAIRICKKAGIACFVSFIAGLPGETKESLEETKKFADELNCFYGFHILAPFLGTTVRENIGEYDLEIETDDWSLYDANHAVARTNALSADKINGFVNNFETEISKEWNQNIAKWRKGTNPPHVEFQVEGHFRTQFIFHLLSEDLLEKHGEFPVTSLERLTSLLAKRLSTVTTIDLKLIEI
ncbi:MAG: radical SAM protein, partial [Deltaproteobacteria bacterium]